MSKRGNEDPFLPATKKKKPSNTSVPSQAPPPAPAPAIRDTLPARLRKILRLPLKIGKYRRFYGVEAFWDFENAGLPSNCTASDLKQMIDSALKAFHPKLYLEELIGFGDVENFKLEDYAILKTQFNITKVISREKFCKMCSTGSNQRVTDIADAALIQGMLLYGYDLTPPGNILVITGDEDFAKSISALRDRGFTMFLAHLGHATDKLLNSSTVNWFWNKMTAGKGPGRDN